MEAEWEARFNGYTFLETHRFAAKSDDHLGQEGMQILQDALNSNPNAGDVIPGTSGARKPRIALSGRGKRGGGRVIYFFRDTRNAIYLLDLYAKNRKSDLTEKEKKDLQETIKTIIKENYP